MVLLTPGPCATTETVRMAGAQPDLNHRDPEFLRIFRDTREQLLAIYPGTADWHCYLIGGSGTAAAEALVTSAGPERRSVAICNGYYSDRLAELLPTEVTRIEHPWTEAWNFGALERAMSEGAYEKVVGVHHETTTGRLNDVAVAGELCHRYGALFLVDAVSSFGVEEIDFRHVDAICSSSNKCLHGVAGVSFVLGSPRFHEQVMARGGLSYYLDLRHYSGDSPLMTPPVPAILSLHQALVEYEGQQARRITYRKRAGRIRTALQNLDFRPLLHDSLSVTMTGYHAPAGFSGPSWIEANRQLGYLLYGCKGELRESCFQVANMGALTDEQIDGWLEVVRRLLGAR